MRVASATVLKARRLWLQVHKWIGLLLAILIIPVSVTGSALVWHDGLDEMLNPERVVEAAPAQAPSAYAEAAKASLQPGERIAQLRMPEGGQGAVFVAAARPPVEGQARPVRTNMWLHPETAAVVDTAASNEGAVRVLHVLHGSLMVPGVGRQIVGWVGVFMLISCLTGIWLWWPVTGGVRRGFRWKRQPSFNANLHHQLGFWVLVPLAMLSFTGVWISFPQTFSGFEASAPDKGGALKAPPRPPQPLEQTALTPDAAVAAARAQAGGAELLAINWPTDQRAEWTVSFARAEGGPAEYRVADEGARVTPPGPAQPETIARLMRRWHDGTGMGFGWQLIIFLGGIIPAILSVTGILMWWRSRKWRGGARRRPRAEPVAAE
jgi:uncharacterized iron-regulated membrane protein